MRDKAFIKTPFHLDDFGYSILLLFWALVGWEIIGNYSLDVKNRKRTIPQAIVISSVVITTVCIVVAASYQWIDLHHTHTLTIILIPLLGTFASPTMAFITTILCMSTYLLVTGGVSRLIASENKNNLDFFPLQNKHTNWSHRLININSYNRFYSFIYKLH